VDCASERVLVVAGVDVGASVNAGGQGSQVPDCHIELCEGSGAVGKLDSEDVKVEKDVTLGVSVDAVPVSSGTVAV
jgi:hypothetical protein